jgi:hypothetical protein
VSLTSKLNDFHVVEEVMQFLQKHKNFHREAHHTWSSNANIKIIFSSSTAIGGGFHKSWVHGVKRKVHPNLGENTISWA